MGPGEVNTLQQTVKMSCHTHKTQFFVVVLTPFLYLEEMPATSIDKLLWQPWNVTGWRPKIFSFENNRSSESIRKFYDRIRHLFWTSL